MLDIEPHTTVYHLDDLCYDHYYDGRKVREHLCHKVLFQSHGWATLLVGFRLYRKYGWTGPEYHIVRMRRLAGAWRKFSHFPMKAHHINGFVSEAATVMRSSEEICDAEASRGPTALGR
jgi:hypothetical protein